jgi:FecR protein
VTYKTLLFSAVVGCLLTGSALGQDVISARSGLIHYTEGEVFLADKPVVQKLGEYPAMKAGEHLRTETGRAEVLLTPGVFLRLSENSEIAMTTNALTDTRIDIVKGSVLLEAGEISKEQAIELTVQGSVLDVKKRGVFRIDAGTPPRVRVFDGEITVADVGRSLTVKEGRQALLTSVPVIEKFSKEDTDSFYRWAGRRSGYLALANVSAARRMYDNYGPGWTTGGWYFNPYFGMFTYFPGRGRYTNAWNHSYYAPIPPAAVHQPMPSMDSFAGMSPSRGMSNSGGGSYSGGGGVYQAPATSGGGAPAAGPSRSASPGGGARGGGGSR